MTRLLHRARRVVLGAGCAGAVTAVLAACGGDGKGAELGAGTSASEVAEVRVVTSAKGSEYTFEVPERVPAGPTRIALANDGDEAHHAQLFQLDSGASVADLSAALATGNPAAALKHGTFLGGTGLVSAGEESRAEAIIDLTPAEYALVCFVEDTNDTPHVAHGMLRPFTVTGGGTPAPAPEVDLAVELTDFRFELPATIPGDAVLAVTNVAQAEPHEMIVARPDDGATTPDVAAALDQHRALPATGLGGIQALLPDATQLLELDLQPGRYVVICVVTSPDGIPHHAKGMIEEVTVTHDG